MNENDIKSLIDFHLEGRRQGPGSQEETLKALVMSGLKGQQGLKIADIGCGTGASALILARFFQSEIVAVDLFPDFLAKLVKNAEEQGLAHLITPQEASMDSLSFSKESLDLIWSEGAIYNMGFEKGVQSWKEYLKPKGVLAVSEITWLTNTRPEPIHEYWTREYAEIGSASEKITILEKNEFKILGYFPLSTSSWVENYYNPNKKRFNSFLEEHAHSPSAKLIIENERQEIDLYKKYSSYYSYGFYIAQKI